MAWYFVGWLVCGIIGSAIALYVDKSRPEEHIDEAYAGLVFLGPVWLLLVLCHTVSVAAEREE